MATRAFDPALPIDLNRTNARTVNKVRIGLISLNVGRSDNGLEKQ
jgi:hypothetical protein